MKEIFAEKTLTKFKEAVKSKVKTQAEKSKAVEYAKKSQLNDHDKIEFLEKYTGFKLSKSK